MFFWGLLYQNLFFGDHCIKSWFLRTNISKDVFWIPLYQKMIFADHCIKKCFLGPTVSKEDFSDQIHDIYSFFFVFQSTLILGVLMFKELLNYLSSLQHFRKPCTRTGSRSTFEFPSQVNLSGPILYCIAWTLGK